MSFLKLPVLRHGLMIRDQELLPDAVVAERIEKVRRLMSARDVACLIVYSDPTRNGPVCYLTNYPCFGLGRRATTVLGMKEGPFLFTAEPSRNLPRVRIMTTCDLEKTRQFLSAACERAKTVAQGGCIGLVGFANLPAGLVKDTDALKGVNVKDLSKDFSLLTAAKDEAALRATRRALAFSETGLTLLREEAASGKDLWEMAAYVDYRLRLAGCEDSNILLNTSSGGPMRPAHPARIRPLPGNALLVYVAVQYARHWGVVARTLSPAGTRLSDKMALLTETQKKAAPMIQSGMTLREVEDALGEVGRKSGLAFARDISIVSGIGFDLHEYPKEAEDRVERNTVLQVSLAADECCTGMLTGMLQVTDKGGLWLTGAGRE